MIVSTMKVMVVQCRRLWREQALKKTEKITIGIKG